MYCVVCCFAEKWCHSHIPTLEVSATGTLFVVYLWLWRESFSTWQRFTMLLVMPLWSDYYCSKDLKQYPQLYIVTSHTPTDDHDSDTTIKSSPDCRTVVTIDSNKTKLPCNSDKIVLPYDSAEIVLPYDTVIW